MRGISADASALSTKLFVPASLTVLTFGLLMVIDGPWGFDQLWIVLGLSGFAATLATGLFFVKPRTEKIDAMIKRDGGMSDEAALEMQRVLVIGRADVVVLYLIVMDMVLKPTGGQVVVLGVMAAILVAAIAYAIIGVRSLSGPKRFTPATGSPAGA